MSTAKELLERIKSEDIKYVDLRFTDPRGKWQHVTFDLSLVDEDFFSEGMMFDGSSIAGWKAINESDMKLMPDPATACIDPFFAAATLSIVCDVLEPLTGEPYHRDPRGIAKKAEAYLKSTGIGDTAFFGPEAEFFIFDDVRFKADPYNTGFVLDTIELPSNADTDLRGRQPRPPRAHQGRLFPGSAGRFLPGHPRRDARGHGSHGRQGRETPPRSGLRPARTRHQVRPADHDRRPSADLQILHPPSRPCLRQDGDLHAEADLRRQRFGHAVHQSIWKAGKPVMAGDKYADLGQECLYYIGGIIRHAKALNAFTNPSTNSYKRLVPGYRSAGAAGLFGPQPLGLLPHSLDEQPEGQAHRGSLPRSDRQPLSRFRRHADGRTRRHR